MRLLVLLLAVSAGILVLHLGSSTIVSLYDRLGGLSIWNSQIWKTWKISLVTVAVIAGLALLTTAAFLSNRKHETAEKEFALAQGWAYSAKNDDPELIIAKVSAILDKAFPEKRYDVNTVMTVRHKSGNIYLFGCWYCERKPGKYKLGSGCLIESEQLQGTTSQVDIVPGTWIDSGSPFRKVDMGDSEFSRNYVVSTHDPAEAVNAVNEEMRSVLVDYKNSPDCSSYNFEINLGAGGAVILRWAQIRPEEWLTIVELARRFEATMR